MDIRPITKKLAVSPQILASDVGYIADIGFRSIICNRPDGESPDQPSFSEIEAAAKKAGLEVRYLPIVAGQMQPGDPADFAAALTEMPGPVLAYCRTGTRSATLWALMQGAQGQSVSDVLEATKQAGYDMTDVMRRFATAG
ncbi:MAG: TIGR01244 family sulfur transferase [Rhizobiaceae bacterium]|nr:TIGR01244 family sulfur transferase [Rhizobiaceae bacterium]